MFYAILTLISVAVVPTQSRKQSANERQEPSRRRRRRAREFQHSSRATSSAQSLIARECARLHRRTASPGKLLGAVARLCRSRHSRQCRIYGSRQLGYRPAGWSAVQVRPAMGGGPREPDGDLHAGDLRSSWRGNRERSGTVLPRLVPVLDPLAELADERNRHW